MLKNVRYRSNEDKSLHYASLFTDPLFSQKIVERANENISRWTSRARSVIFEKKEEETSVDRLGLSPYISVWLC